MNVKFSSSPLGQHSTPLSCCSGGGDGIKLALKGDESGRLISMALRALDSVRKVGNGDFGLRIQREKAGSLYKTTDWATL